MIVLMTTVKLGCVRRFVGDYAALCCLPLFDFRDHPALLYVDILLVRYRNRKPPMEEPQFKPSGTIAILVIYALIIIVIWASAYFAMLLRGATQ